MPNRTWDYYEVFTRADRMGIARFIAAMLVLAAIIYLYDRLSRYYQARKLKRQVPWTYCSQCGQAITGYEPRTCIDCMSDTDKLANDGAAGYKRLHGG